MCEVPRVPRIASCKRGFERTVPTPDDWDAKQILVWSSVGNTEPFFPECVECKPDSKSITITPDDEGTFHLVKVCCIQFREVES